MPLQHVYTFFFNIVFQSNVLEQYRNDYKIISYVLATLSENKMITIMGKKLFLAIYYKGLLDY